MNLTLAVNPLVFEKHPSFRRGIVVATNVNNSGPRPALNALLHEISERGRQHPIQFETDVGSQTWIRAHREFGSNPNKFPPSHLALRKRIQNGGMIPFISPVVAIMTCASLSAHTSVGGDDVQYTGRSLELRFADGTETFSPLSKPDVCEHPEIGEVIYVDEIGRTLCRRWNWHNAFFSRIRPETNMMVMNIDGLGDESERLVIEARNQVAELLKEHCRAEVTLGLLTPDACELIG